MNQRNPTILIVDDDSGIRMSFSDYLEDRDYRVLMADDGAVGLQLIERESPDLVLLDLRMPVMSGLELLRQARESWPDLPMVVVSGTGRIADAVESLRLGAWDYLLKPIEDLSMLLHVVEKSLERARLTRENRAYQQELERQVRERTAELQEANQRLGDINERLKLIAASAGALSSCLDVHDFAGRLLEESARHLRITDGNTYLVEEDGLRLVQGGDSGQTGRRIGFPLPDGSVLGRVLQEKQPLLTRGTGQLDDPWGPGDGDTGDSSLVFPITDEQGQVYAILALRRDGAPSFSEQDKEIGGILASYGCETVRAMRAFQALKASEQRFRELAEMLPQTVCETDRSGTITYANRQAFQSFGYGPEDLGRVTVFDMIESSQRQHAVSNLLKVLQHGQALTAGTEYTAIRKDGSRFPALVYSTPIFKGDAAIGVRAVLADISVHKKQEDLILHQAHFDNLTDLPNRFLAIDRLAQMLREAQRAGKRVAVLFVDLDDFKKINDTLGHDIGDRLLIQAAERLSHRVRNVDTIGRQGGDEFILLLGGLVDAADARPVAADILDRFREPFQLDGRELILTASIGVSIYPEDGVSPVELLRKADTAMYHAKEQGRNTYRYFTASLNQAVARRLMVEEHLQGALERGELTVHYQPVVDLGDHAVVAFEALLRWNNRVMGEVPPDEFIPIAEQTGLIVPIGWYVLTQALARLAAWRHRHGRDYRIAVNLSPRQFRDPGLVERLQETLRETGLAPQSLELEITEGVLMNGLADVQQTLAAVSELGIGISMDDFGTGYSSLSYLRQYPFNTMKIDRDFIRDLTVDTADRELVNAAIAMAHSLGLAVVAEGVETEQQLAHLREQGCEYAQGYLFGEPLMPEELEAMMERREGIFA